MNDAVWRQRLDNPEFKVALDDDVLEDRLSNLWASLHGVADADAYAQYLSRFSLDREVQTQVNRTIGAEGRRLVNRLAEILATEDKAVAWQEYCSLYRDCQEFLREALEFLGAMVLRDKLPGPDLYGVVDRLIMSWQQSTFGPLSITMPASEDTHARQLWWVLRVRFPEWSVWAVPYAIHTYWYLAWAKVQELRPGELNARLDEWVKEDIEAGRVNPEGKEKARQQLEGQVRVLLADAYATHTMGPAYACAAIFLRFDMSTACEASDPPSTHRAHLILRMLEQAAPAPGPILMGSSKGLPARLRETWIKMLDSAGRSADLVAHDQERLEKILRLARDVIQNQFMPTARYRHDDAYNDIILQQVNDPDPELRLPADSLALVLNAAWLCRLDHPERKGELTTAANRLCDLVLRPGAISAAGQAPRPVPSGPPAMPRFEDRERPAQDRQRFVPGDVSVPKGDVASNS